MLVVVFQQVQRVGGGGRVGPSSLLWFQGIQYTEAPTKFWDIASHPLSYGPSKCIIPSPNLS